MTERTALPPAAGLSLVEVLIGAFVGAVILAVVATVLVTTLQSAATTQDRDLATGRAQAISTSLSTSVRTAESIRLEQSESASIVRAVIPTDAAAWECNAWAVADLDGDGDAEFLATSYEPLAEDDPIPQPADGWGVLAEHVDTTDTYFTLVEGHLSWDLVVVAAEQQQLSDGDLAGVAGSALARGASTEESARCW